jgi:predicted enzyme involved in methoxymalonyl-ACP biosynthesis
VCCELARAGAPARKAYCLDCDNTLWGGAVGVHGIVLSEAYLGVQRRFVARQARGALVCLVSHNHEVDVRAVLMICEVCARAPLIGKFLRARAHAQGSDVGWRSA